MNRHILFIILISSFLSINAQAPIDNLLSGEYISSIGFQCEKTPKPTPCAGVEMFLALNFSKEHDL
ncbi:hypothetical protein [Reichenbachiella versicolor]|uniref:hypothetical protein n=1 Tax=Reichenbachiella versicolor TaxID=1821036 RepID=UPI001C86DBD2|nr:hypothetical protein [Reichenbachiella versicolor]